MLRMKASEYAKIVVGLLSKSFPDQEVIEEWDSSSRDIYIAPHKQMYFPRTDIVVGPFNHTGELDVGIDKTNIMRKHPLSVRLMKEKELVWNDLSRCYLAIEIVFSGSTKHIMGDLLNVSLTGSLGIVVARKGECYEKARRLLNYIRMRFDSEEMPLSNIALFEESELTHFLLK